MENNQEVYIICFVDYDKAFDRVDWKKLINILRRKSVDWRDRRLIGNLNMGQQIRVKIEGELSEPGSIGRWVRQGAHSHLYCSTYIGPIEELVREALQNSEEGVKVGGKLIKALRFADDQAMVAGKEKD